jgi:hypothetical protein
VAPGTPPDVALPTRRSTRHLLLVGAGVAADTASLPQPALGPSLTLAARPLASLAVELSGAYFPSQTAMVTGTVVGGQLDLFDGSLRACYERRSRIELGACAGAFVDRIHGEAVGVRNTPQTSVYGGPLAAGSVRFAATDWLAFRALVEAAVPLSRQPFVIDNFNGGNPTVHNPPAVAGRSILGLEASF